MLQLKSGLASLSLSCKVTTPSLSELPQEILGIILEFLYWDSGGRLHSLLPASQTCRPLRSAALPHLFGSISCVVRQANEEIPHRIFPRIVSQSHLLKHVKTLIVQKPLLSTVPTNTTTTGGIKNDLILLESALKHMSQLQQISLRCSLVAATEVLRLLHSQNDFSTITVSQVPTAFTRPAIGHGHDVYHLSGARIAPVGHTAFGNEAPVPKRVQLASFKISMREAHQNASSADPRIDPAPAVFPFSLSGLIELCLGSQVLECPVPFWQEVCSAVPWSKLRRLRIHHFHHQVRLQEVMSSLVGLEDLVLKASGPSSLHTGCPYGWSTPSMYAHVHLPYFHVNFAALPSLRTLEIEGICNHIPIQNLVGPGLRALKLHQPESRSSVTPSESQRSASDLIAAAQLAPRLRKLELDIGHIENLWHPTAIPGQDIDPQLYSFLAAFSKFKNLKEVRLFPPFATKESTDPAHWGMRPCIQRQPLSDELAVRMFHHIRGQCSRLVLLAISVTTSGIIPIREFSPMNWEVRPWGESTLLATRQWKKDYELRQIWVGERRLTMEIKRDTHSKYHIPWSEHWLFDPNAQF